MNEKFYNLSKEKQDRMINGAMKVFALNGYEKASTDVIIKEAGISKGLLFHYFGSKKNLYEFVVEYCGRYLSVELAAGISDAEKNIFERIRLAEEAKLRMLKNYPYLDLLLICVQSEIHPDAAECAKNWADKVDSLYESLINGAADEALLRGSLTLESAREIADMCISGYKSKYYRLGVEPVEVLNGLIPYLKLLKENFTR